ncbi:MAG: hypothetical protein AVDCRST_MAG19-608, partial [uncultured Thermomicrobiales bacterium]
CRLPAAERGPGCLPTTSPPPTTGTSPPAGVGNRPTTSALGWRRTGRPSRCPSRATGPLRSAPSAAAPTASIGTRATGQSWATWWVVLVATTGSRSTRRCPPIPPRGSRRPGTGRRRAMATGYPNLDAARTRPAAVSRGTPSRPMLEITRRP